MKNDKIGGVKTPKIPEPIDTEFDVSDCARDVTPHANIQSDRPSGGVPANRWIITLAWFLVFIHFCELSFYSAPETKQQNRFLTFSFTEKGENGTFFAVLPL